MPRLIFIALLILLLVSVRSRASEWSAISSGTQRDLESVRFSSASYGWIAGHVGEARSTTDGGRTWRRRDVGTTESFSAVSVRGVDTVAFSTSAGSLIVMRGDELRQPSRPISGARFYDVAFLDAETIVAVGQVGTDGRGVVVRSTNGGESWSEVGSGGGIGAQVLARIRFLNSTDGYLLARSPSGSSGRWVTTIAKTQDAGATWEVLYRGAPSDFEPRDICLLSPGGIIVVGRSESNVAAGYMLSRDGGLTWDMRRDQAFQRADAIVGLDARTAFVTVLYPAVVNGELVDRPLVLRTDSYGFIWRGDGAPEQPGRYAAIAAVPGQGVIVAGEGGSVLRRSILCATPTPQRPLPTAISRPIGASLSVHSVAEGGEVRYVWFKDGKLLEEEGEPVFTIARLRRQDEGVYELVMSNDCGAHVQQCTVNLRAEGILIASRPHIALHPVVVGAERDTLLRAVVRNEGTAPVHVLGARVFGGNGDVSLLASAASKVIHPGDSLDLALRFRPTNTGIVHAVLDINTESDIDPSMWITAAAFQRDQPNGLSIHHPIQFEGVKPYAIRDTLVPRLLHNSSARAISITGIRIEGAHAYHFALVDDVSLPITLQPQESFGATIRFAPLDPGTYGAHLSCVVDDQHVTIPLSGVSGFVGDAEVVNYVDIRQGEERDTLITLYHIYDMGLRIDSVEDVVGPFEIVETTPTLPAVLHGWEYLTVRVRFRPEQHGVHVSPMRVYWEVPETGERISAARRVLRGAQRAPATHVESWPSSGLEVAPTPISADVAFRSVDGSNIRAVRVYGSNGALVMDVGSVGASACQLSAAGLASGIYRFDIHFETGRIETVVLPVIR